jgi:hypothetical protein
MMMRRRSFAIEAVFFFTLRKSNMPMLNLQTTC